MFDAVTLFLEVGERKKKCYVISHRFMMLSCVLGTLQRAKLSSLVCEFMRF